MRVHDDELAALYDAETMAALEGWTPRDDASGQLLPSRLAKWSRTSTMGLVAAGFAFGLREVLDPPRDEKIVIEVDAEGEPHDLPIRLFLDPDDPSGSLCILRADPPPPVV